MQNNLEIEMWKHKVRAKGPQGRARSGPESKQSTCKLFAGTAVWQDMQLFWKPSILDAS